MEGQYLSGKEDRSKSEYLETECENEETRDDESTLDEEERVNPVEDYAEELRILEHDANLSVEELRKLYYGEGAVDEEEMIEEESSLSEESMESAESHDANGSFANAETSHDQSSDKLEPSFDFLNDDVDDEDDDEYVPPSEAIKRVKIGPFCQAIIPDQKTTAPPPESDAELLWSPYNTSEEVVENYLRNCCGLSTSSQAKSTSGSNVQSSSSAQSSYLPDDEKALKALLNANYDTNLALSNRPFSAVNRPVLTLGENPARWTREECTQFEDGFEQFGKNFSLIRQHVLPHKKVGELVRFYYTWKKTERYDMFQNRIRGPTAHAHCTDIVENLMEHFDKVARDARAQSSSATVSLTPNSSGSGEKDTVNSSGSGEKDTVNSSGLEREKDTTVNSSSSGEKDTVNSGGLEREKDWNVWEHVPPNVTPAPRDDEV